MIDAEVKQIISNCKEITRETLLKHRVLVEKLLNFIVFSNFHGFFRKNSLANCLLERETIDLSTIVKILGERPFPPRSNYREYLETKQIIDQESEEIAKKQEEKGGICAELAKINVC